MMQHSLNGILSKEFFEVLEKYKAILEMTKDAEFKKFAPVFLEMGAQARIDQIDEEIKTIDTKINLLRDYSHNFSKYELAVDERNWGYYTEKERELVNKVYSFLCANYNYGKRSNTLKQLFANKKNLVFEKGKAISVLAARPPFHSSENTKYFRNLPKANTYYDYLSKEFEEFVASNPDMAIVKNHNLADGFSREQFDSIIDEILNLGNSKTKKPEQTEQFEQLKLF